MVDIDEFIAAAQHQPRLMRYFKEVDRMTMSL